MPAQPGLNGRSKTQFWPLHHGGGEIPLKKAAKHYLTHAASDLHRWGKCPGKFVNAVIQKGSTHFQAHAHAGSVYLGQYVVRKIGDCVAVHHSAEFVLDVNAVSDIK